MKIFNYTYNDEGNIIIDDEPKITKDTVLHLKRDILLKLLRDEMNLLEREENGFDENEKFYFYMRIGRKSHRNKRCEVFNVLYQNNFLRFYIQSPDDKDIQYKITIHPLHLEFLKEILRKMKERWDEKKLRLAIVRIGKIEHNFDKNKILAPSIDFKNVRKLLEETFKIKIENNKQKLLIKRTFLKDIEYPNQFNDQIVKYNVISIKKNETSGLSMKFRINDETFKVLFDNRTMWMMKRGEI